MPAKWSTKDENIKRAELQKLYIIKNKSISEISKSLNLADSTVYDRLLRLGIKPDRSKKIGFNNIRHDVCIPKHHSKKLSEFFGIMLGDGSLTPTQVTVTLGNKEVDYINYISKLINGLFKINPKIYRRKKGYYVIYFGSTRVVRWLLSNGLVFNKVKYQVSIPSWIFSKKTFMTGFLKGFFDTDGSIYKLKFGVQLAFTNRSLPMLGGISRCLKLTGYCPSKISQFRVYITRRLDIIKFFKVVDPANTKHKQRYHLFITT